MTVALYLNNAARMWTELASDTSDADDLFRAETARATRLIARARVPLTVLDDVPPDRAYTFEDAFGDPADGLLRLPIMVRPSSVSCAPFPVRGEEALDPDTLAVTERVMVEAFPVPRYQPLTSGDALPPRLLDRPGWRFWLVRRDGVPAAAAYTFDDGEAVGVYWVATLPEHRGHGLARAVMTTALAAAPGRPAALVATEAGRPLYESLGFEVVGWVNWHARG